MTPTTPLHPESASSSSSTLVIQKEDTHEESCTDWEEYCFVRNEQEHSAIISNENQYPQSTTSCTVTSPPTSVILQPSQDVSLSSPPLLLVVEEDQELPSCCNVVSSSHSFNIYATWKSYTRSIFHSTLPTPWVLCLLVFTWYLTRMYYSLNSLSPPLLCIQNLHNHTGTPLSISHSSLHLHDKNHTQTNTTTNTTCPESSSSSSSSSSGNIYHFQTCWLQMNLSFQSGPCTKSFLSSPVLLPTTTTSSFYDKVLSSGSYYTTLGYHWIDSMIKDNGIVMNSSFIDTSWMNRTTTTAAAATTISTWKDTIQEWVSNLWLQVDEEEEEE